MGRGGETAEVAAEARDARSVPARLHFDTQLLSYRTFAGLVASHDGTGVPTGARPGLLRRAAAAYGQGFAASPTYPYAGRAEKVDLHA